MEKLVIKITVYKDVDPDLYNSVSHLPLRRRAAAIRRLWRQGLRTGSPKIETRRPADAPGVQSTCADGAAVTADQGCGGADDELLRRHLDGLSGLTAFA